MLLLSQKLLIFKLKRTRFLFLVQCYKLTQFQDVFSKVKTFQRLLQVSVNIPQVCIPSEGIHTTSCIITLLTSKYLQQNSYI